VQTDELLLQLKQEAKDSFADTIQALNQALDDIRAGQGEASTLFRQICYDIHNLKGMGGTYGYPVVSVVAHRFEEQLSDINELTADNIRVMQRGVDILEDVTEHHLEAKNDTIADIVRQFIPVGADEFDETDIVVRHVEVMLVAEAGIATKMVSRELKECGYRVSHVSDPFEAMKFTVIYPPDLLIVNAVMENLGGIDLIRGLKSMKPTSRVPMALLTSWAEGDARLADVPSGVPILRKSSTFSDDIAQALIGLGVV
tara:strand:- start:714 stop:1484 length:771 start_codon:yes stop_codon:yes gene_type:complete